MKAAFCIWCWKPVDMADDYNDKKHKAICSVGCKDAESVFTTWQSDEELNRKRHYQALTSGGGDGQNRC